MCDGELRMLTRLAMVMFLTLSVFAEDGIEVWPGTTLKFATAEEGARILAEKDAYLKAFTPLDRAARMKSAKPINDEEFLTFVAKQTRNWTQEERETIEWCFNSCKDLAKINIDWPPNIKLPRAITLVKTTGEEEPGLNGYIRGATIILSEANMKYDESTLRLFLLSKLFLISLRDNPTLISESYAVFGFRVCEPIELPDDIQRRRLVTPNQIEWNVVTELTMKTRKCTVLPLTYAKTDSYDPQIHKDFMDFSNIGLLVLEKKDGKYTPVLSNGKPEILALADAPDQYQKVMGYYVYPQERLGYAFAGLFTMNRDSWPKLFQSLHKVIYRSEK
jgi:hypothetical protein